MANVNWSVSIEIAGGPTLSAAHGPVAVEATDHIDVSVAAGDADKVVDLQPGAADSLYLLMIKSSRYGEDITYKVSDGAGDSDAIILAGPQILSGGIVSLYGRAPHALKFSNAGSSAADLTIFVARDATP